MAVWKYTVDLSGVFHDKSKTFEERRDGVVRILYASRWVKAKDEFDDLFLAIEELSETYGTEEFNLVWDAIYDIADYDRAWIKTF